MNIGAAAICDDLSSWFMLLVLGDGDESRAWLIWLISLERYLLTFLLMLTLPYFPLGDSVACCLRSHLFPLRQTDLGFPYVTSVTSLKRPCGATVIATTSAVLKCELQLADESLQRTAPSFKCPANGSKMKIQIHIHMHIIMTMTAAAATAAIPHRHGLALVR